MKIKVGKGQKLYERAKKIIPGGTQLLSKRPEMFLPEQWPAYYKKARGCEIWDMDGKHYFDMSIMGIGACVLGYAHPKVNKAVISAVQKGSMTTLNSYEEVELTEKLLALHPWAGGVRYTRTGGEACKVAVRIARAKSGKDVVAFCGYHGWHDWYLAANLANKKNLDGQLLPGLDPGGVPRGLKGSAVPFKYGQVDELEDIVKKNPQQVGVIYMEVERHKELNLEFLNAVRNLTNKIGAVLVFDEVSSGFRVSVGGMHVKYGLKPDMLVLGKALGNGHPISAVIGKKSVMKAAEKSFISSSYWTERVGFVAGLATIEVFEKQNVIDKIVTRGSYLIEKMEVLIEKHDLNIEIVGMPSVVILVIKEDKPLLVKSIFTQEMLKRGFLASNVTYVSLAHTKTIVDMYLKNVDQVFGQIAQAKQTNRLQSILEGPVCHGGFKRLN
ncbi:aminotransferase class III-fold pyridoxal phosphate-dependent enzyme [Pseudomonadota bacterium]